MATATASILEDEKARIALLVAAAQAGDRDAFGALFENFERRVFSIAMRRLRNHSEAQELCQDVFIRALQKLNQLRVRESFGAWIQSIAHRMAINRAMRRPLDRAAESSVLDAARADECTPLCNLLAGERHEHVHAALQRLRKLDRDTLESFYVDGCSLLEMCEEFGAPLGTIKRRLHIARKRLAKEVELLTAV
ncbi:MAG: RNA polymerase sigma factor [Pirellulaceae bacterium]